MAYLIAVPGFVLFVAFLRIPVCSTIHVRQCPQRSIGLEKWGDSSTWENGQFPEEGSDVVIDTPILLNIDPPPLHSITITSEGYLIWSTSKNLHLKVHWINVEGELHIGGEDCRQTKDIRITFLGNYADVDPFGFDKGLYVQSGGVFEIHGEEKLSWTKLTQTAYKPSVDQGNAVVEQLNTQYVNWDEKALLVYNINPLTGDLVSEDHFVLSTTKNSANNNMQDFVNYIDAIPSGNIIGFAVLRKIDKSNPIDLSVFEDKVAELGYGDVSAYTPVREVEYPGAYAFVTKKGDYSSTIESYVNTPGESTSDASVVQIFGDVRVFIKSYVHSKTERNFVKLLVSKGEDSLSPKLDLLDDVSSWKVGDDIVIASTDFNWRQAEVRQIVSCSDCSANQIRINDSLEYTHYGNIYKNVDMRAEVGLLTRNILFDSEDATDAVGYGGHLRFLEGFQSVRVEGAEFVNLGAPHVLGRYSLHFHICKDVEGRQYLKQNSIHHANTRCITVHGTHHAQVLDNLCFMTKGHSYFLEDGGERDTIFDGNLGLGTEFGEILLSDREEPTTFWITNPNTRMRNNVAVGSDGNGFWFVYPDEPLGPSAGLGFMLLHEARYTPIPEFYNNVAHSNAKFGLNIDFILHPDETTTGYNLWVGKENPVMHALYDNSTDKETVIEKFTGFKNAERNIWIRSGLLTMRQCSFSDSLISTVLIRMTTYNEVFFEDSVVVGNSDNIGEPLILEGAYRDRSYPKPSQPDHPQIGWEILKKPDVLNKIWFHGFPADREYDMGAIGFRINSKLRTSPQHQFTNMEFSFDDPQEGNRVINYPPGHPYYTDEDGDDNESFIDIDGSVTGYPDMTVILPVPFHLTDACFIRLNWKMALCKHHYATIRVNYGKDVDEDDITSDTEDVETSSNNLIMARDDDHTIAFQEHDIGTQAPFIVIVGGSHSYSMRFTQEWPDQEIKIFGLSVTFSEYVRVGICIPRASTFTLKRNYPDLKTTDWQQASSFADLDFDVDGDMYYIDSEVGYLAILYRHTIDKNPGDVDECPDDECLLVRLELDLTNADPTDVDCFPRLYAKYPPNQLLPQNGPPVQVAEFEIDDRTLSYTSRNPPSTWGAGASKLPVTKK